VEEMAAGGVAGAEEAAGGGDLDVGDLERSGHFGVEVQDAAERIARVFKFEVFGEVLRPPHSA
jgi:hypothetical protein